MWLFPNTKGRFWCVSFVFNKIHFQRPVSEGIKVLGEGMVSGLAVMVLKR